MTSFPRRQVLGLAVAAAATAFAAPALAAYPERPVTMVVPFAAGGPTDSVARALARAMEGPLGQSIVVENKPSAGGVVAPADVAKAKPDGYRILIHHIGMATSPGLYRKLAFNPATDFEYLGLVNSVPMTLVAKPNFPANNLAEAMTYVKANAAKINLANAGLGSASHLCGLLFQQKLNTVLTTVPYKGTGPAMTDLIGGQTDLMCDQTTSTSPHILGGKVKAYAITTAKRVDTLKDIPTAAEAGLKDFELGIWHGLYAPKGTPADVTKKLNDALRTALKDPAFRKSMSDAGALVWDESMQTPEAHRKLVAAETERWGTLIRAAGQFAD